MEVVVDIELSGDQHVVEVTDPDMLWGDFVALVAEVAHFDARDITLHTGGVPYSFTDDDLLQDSGVSEGTVLSLRHSCERILQEVKRGKKLRTCPAWAWYDRGIVLEAVTRQGKDRNVFGLASEVLRADKEIAKAAVRLNGRSLEFASADLRACFELVHTAVCQHGCALEFAAPELKMSDTIVLSAVLRQGCALQYAHPSLLTSRDFVLEAVRRNGIALQHVPVIFRQDLDVCRLAVRHNPKAKQYAMVDAESLWGVFSPDGDRPGMRFSVF